MSSLAKHPHASSARSLSEALNRPSAQGKLVGKALSGFRKLQPQRSSNNIGFLHTTRQPHGSNAYFSLLRLKLDASKLAPKKQKRSRQPKLPLRGLVNSKCVCGSSCTCGRRALIQEVVKDSTLSAFLSGMDFVRASTRKVKASCVMELESVKRRVASLQKGLAC